MELQRHHRRRGFFRDGFEPVVIYDATNQRFAIFTYFEDTAFVTASMRGSYVVEAGAR